MTFKKLHSRLLGLALGIAFHIEKVVAAENLYKPRPNLFLLETFDPARRSLENNGRIDIAFEYFKLAWPWIIGSAGGIAVIWGMVAGIMIMSSGENSDLRTRGQEHLMTVIKGLILIALSGLVLTTLNSVFYRT